MFILFRLLGMVSEPQSKMEKKGEHEEGTGATCAQLPSDDVQRRAHGPGGDCPQRTGEAGKKEKETRKTPFKIPEQTHSGGLISHPRI